MLLPEKGMLEFTECIRVRMGKLPTWLEIAEKFNGKVSGCFRFFAHTLTHSAQTLVVYRPFSMYDKASGLGRIQGGKEHFWRPLGENLFMIATSTTPLGE